MLPIIEGDITDFPSGISCIAHGCNTMGIMGSGLALQMARKYPEVRSIDQQAFQERKVCLGHFSYVQLPDRRLIFNLYQQITFGHLNLLALQKSVEAALTKITELRSKEPLEVVGPYTDTTLALPYKIGCGLAKGNWQEVKAMLWAVSSRNDNRIILVKRPQDT